jgi:S-adenosylmethionine hydrolase
MKATSENRIVIITDCTDVAYSEMRGRILADVTVDAEIEPLVPVIPFSVIHGAFLTRLMADSYPKRTILFCVVSPGGPGYSRPKYVIGMTKNGYVFIGPDTGTFSWLADDCGIEILYQVWMEKVQFSTFGGKHVLAPAIATFLNSGRKFEAIGAQISLDSMTGVNIPNNMVVHVDNFGTLKLKGIKPEMDEGCPLQITVGSTGKKFSAVFGHRFMDFSDRTLVVTPGSSLWGLPEIALTRGSATSFLGVGVGDILKIEAV